MAELISMVASAQDIGTRSRQEDAVVAHASHGADPLLAVLSDGMGGHDDGDLASRIIASEMFGELFIAAARKSAMQRQSTNVFRAALNCANLRLKQHIDAGRLGQNTGGTLICVTIHDNQLRWISVGDSSLYLLRDNTLRRLNVLHSMAAQLDLMVANDQIDAETAKAHPDRHCLTSAVTGREIVSIDCPDGAQNLLPGDVVVLASDGIDVLTENDIARIVKDNKEDDCAAIARALLNAVKKADVPDQDNTSIIVIKSKEAVPKRRGAIAWLGHRIVAAAGFTWHCLGGARLRT